LLRWWNRRQQREQRIQKSDFGLSLFSLLSLVFFYGFLFSFCPVDFFFLLVRVPVGKQVGPLLSELNEIRLVPIDVFHANLPRTLGRGRPAKKNHGTVRRVAGVMLHVG